jgi:hypothetical protein
MSGCMSKSVCASQNQADRSIPAADRAAMYLRRLEQFDLQARDSLPENRVLFFRRLRVRLEEALKCFQKSAAGWNESVEDFESYTELDWLCNLCEYWLGPAEGPDQSQLFRKCADMRRPAPAITLLENMAVYALVKITSVLVQARRNPLVLFPRPLRTCTWMMRNLRIFIAQEQFALKRIRRRFLPWLKAFLLRLG